MLGPDTRRRLSAGGFVVFGGVGAVVAARSLAAGSAAALPYVALFAAFLVAGVALAAGRRRFTAGSLLAGAALATVLGLGRMAALGAADGFAVALVAMGLTSGWKGYQYYRSPGRPARAPE